MDNLLNRKLLFFLKTTVLKEVTFSASFVITTNRGSKIPKSRQNHSFFFFFWKRQIAVTQSSSKNTKISFNFSPQQGREFLRRLMKLS